ncbi:MAG: hypothetical protein VB106_04120 [Clostridiaceae bacterium]|nr:hypothetical protein [Clostridiaceae bacterium]
MWKLNAEDKWDFTFDKAGINVLTALEEKAKLVEWKRGKRNEHFILFSISGFTNELTELAKTRNDVLLRE